MQIRPTDVIVFQGDSITDGGRDRAIAEPNHPAALGRGYAMLTAASLLAEQPGLRIYNKGVSGDRITYMAKRWQTDCLDLQPTIVSILIGINDTWHGVAKGTPENGVGLDEYDRVYRQLLKDTRAQLPGVKVVVCEPFVTEAGVVLEMNFHPDVDDRRKLAKAIAEEYADVWVPFQSMFDDALKRADPAYWCHDGVHPTLAGHRLMADFWLDRVNKA